MLAAELLDIALNRMDFPDDLATDKRFRLASHRDALTSMRTAHDRLTTLVDPHRRHELLMDETLPAERWKECIRIQQLQADMARVIPQLDRPVARRTKWWWYAMMEVIFVLRRKDFDVPPYPVTVPRWATWRIAWLATFRKSAFHR